MFYDTAKGKFMNLNEERTPYSRIGDGVHEYYELKSRRSYSKEELGVNPNQLKVKLNLHV